MLLANRIPACQYRRLWRGRLNAVTREDSPPLVVELDPPLRSQRLAGLDHAAAFASFVVSAHAGQIVHAQPIPGRA